MKNMGQLAFQKKIIKEEYVTEKDINHRVKELKKLTNRSGREWKQKSI
ncbi:hypothetical protein [Peribacillus muralis]